MSTVKVKDLQVGMKVKDHVLGARGDVKVSKGEILSKAHVDKLNSWNKNGTVDRANKNGIETEQTIKSGSAEPAVVDHPELSPVVNNISKNKLQSSMRVPVSFDKDGNVIYYDEDGNPIENKEVETDNIPTQEPKNDIIVEPKKRGRPKGS